MNLDGLQAVPAEMRESARWLCWKFTDDRTKKPPVDNNGIADRNWTDPLSWLTLARATQRVAKVAADGVGFHLGENWGGLDLDECIDERGNVDPRALAILDMVPGAYTETSPSGRGLKVFGRGDGWVEAHFYPDKVSVVRKQSGYFTVTGLVYREGGVPDLPLDAIYDFFAAQPANEARSEYVRTAALPEAGADIGSGRQDDWLRNRAWRHANRGMQFEDVLAQLRVDINRCPPSGAPWTEADLQRHARSACAKVEVDPVVDPYPASDAGAAEFFVSQYMDDVRYDHRRHRWLVWDGVRWTPDATEKVNGYFIEAARLRIIVANKIEDEDVRKLRVKSVMKGDNVRSVEDAKKFARGMRPIETSGDEFDRDPSVLGVPNGVVDLQTGDLKPGKPEDLITMQARFAFDPAAKAPLWEATIADILKDHVELVPYVQKALGYSLTGDCREEIFFLCTGGGRNGKDTLLTTVQKVMGDYADDLSFASLEAGKFGGDSGAATPDLAKLVGKRFVTAAEANGGRFNEARLKRMTGRNPITTRFLHANEFTFMPSFKLWLAVNDLPRVKDASDGFWSRPHRIPFLQSYLGREDKTLKDRLIDEGPGILAWLVRGAVAWYKEGLGKPTVVTAAVQAYQKSQEPLAEWLRDETRADTTTKTAGPALYASYKSWADDAGLHGRQRLGRTSFYEEVRKHFPKNETDRNGQLVVTGIRLGGGLSDAENAAGGMF